MERGFRFSRTFVEYVQVFQLELVSSGLICITDVSSPISSPHCWSTFHNGVKKLINKYRIQIYMGLDTRTFGSTFVKDFPAALTHSIRAILL